MNDKTPTPDQTPESTPNAPTVPVTPTPDAATPAAAPAAAKSGRNRALIIGGSIAAAVILIGGGVALGAAITDEFGDDDRSPMSDGPRDSDNEGAGDRNDHDHARDDARDDARNDTAPSNGRGPAADIGTASADELIEIANAARGAADGEVTSIDAERDGVWEVQLTNAAGDDTSIRVDDSLAASVISTDAADGDDTGPVLTLDDDTIRALVAAALAEADGLITDLDVDTDAVSPYDVSVLTSDNRSVDIDFDADFAVIATDG